MGSTREVRVFVRLVCRVTCDLHKCLNETCYILCIHVIAVAIFTYLHPIFNPFSPHTHSFKWEKPELQYTANISDYQVHLALEPLGPNEMPDQIGSQVILLFPYSVSNFTLLNVFSRLLSYLVPLLKILLALIPAKHTSQYFYRYNSYAYYTPLDINYFC